METKIDKRIFKIISLTYLATLAITWRAFVGERSFPKVSLGEISLPPAFEYILFGGLVGGLLYLVFFYHYAREVIVFITVCWLITVCADQNRLQPYFYAFHIFLLISVLAKKPSILSLQTALALFYFWAGIHKLNMGFLKEIVPYFLPSSWYQNYYYATWIGFLPAIGESLMGVGLLTLSYRHHAKIGIVAMHVLLVIWLNPLHSHWNLNIIPWNIGMAWLVYEIFSVEHTQLSALGSFLNKKDASNFLIGICFMIVPLLGIFGVTDSYLSFKLYTGDALKGVIYFNKQTIPYLPEPAQSVIRSVDKNPHIFMVEWSYHELGLLVYPEKRIYEAVATSLNRRLPANNQLNLVLY